MNKFLIQDVKYERSQNDSDINFIGGYPSLPDDVELPVCSLCGAPQTFFFQISFSDDSHCWAGHSLSAFMCTSCSHELYLIPAMLHDELKGVDIPEGFLDSYQKNFKYIISPTDNCKIRTDYNQKIKFIPLKEKKSLFSGKNGIKIDKPVWILEDESPGWYKSTEKMFFLCQVPQSYEFPLVENAPPQIVFDISGNSSESSNDYYEYFTGNSIYLFGTENVRSPGVYVVTQN